MPPTLDILLRILLLERGQPSRWLAKLRDPTGHGGAVNPFSQAATALESTILPLSFPQRLRVPQAGFPIDRLPLEEHVERKIEVKRNS